MSKNTKEAEVKRGRKPMNPNREKKGQRTFYLFDSDYEQIVEIAERSGRSFTSWLELEIKRLISENS